MPTLAETSNGSADSAPIDEAVLATLVEEVAGGDRSLVDELIGSYLGESGEQVKQLSAAAGSNDAGVVASLAHSLKSASAVLGATRLAAMLQQTEDRAKGRSGDLAAMSGPIESEYARVEDALLRLRTAS